MTTTNETKQNIIDHLNNGYGNDLSAIEGVTYCAVDPGCDISYVLTDSGDLLVVDTDIVRVRTSEEMNAAGQTPRCIPGWITQNLGIEIEDDWTIN
jgi:hypothetical protein